MNKSEENYEALVNGLEFNYFDAHENAKRALAIFRPNENFKIKALKPGWADVEEWAFLCSHETREEAFVAKAAANSAHAFAKNHEQFHRLSQTYPALSAGRHRVPKPLAEYPEFGVYFMEFVEGSTLAKLIESAATADEMMHPIKDACAWIEAFQAPTRTISPFNPRPHVNWIRKHFRAVREEGEPKIRNHWAFAQRFWALKDMAPIAENKRTIRCISHRDLHLHNLIFQNDGLIYGIDFENDQEDEALRDLFTPMFHALTLLPEELRNNETRLKIAQKFLNEFQRIGIDDEVVAFFQLFSALGRWKTLNEGQTMNEKDKIRLEAAKWLASHSLIPKMQPYFDREAQK